jgi:hypothetical protein
MPDELESEQFHTPFETGHMPCDVWSERDNNLEKPVPHEFYPRYMRCFIRYGARLAEDLLWQTFEPWNQGSLTGLRADPDDVSAIADLNRDSVGLLQPSVVNLALPRFDRRKNEQMAGVMGDRIGL